jgi:hypothetical protein
MKVKKAIEMLSELNQDDDIAIIWWERDMFSRIWDDDKPWDAPSAEAWSIVVTQFDKSEEPYSGEIWDWIHEGLIDNGAWND